VEHHLEMEAVDGAGERGEPLWGVEALVLRVGGEGLAGGEVRVPEGDLAAAEDAAEDSALGT